MVNVLFGFDVESPYGNRALTVDGAREREENLELIRRINTTMDEQEAERTFFLLGDYLKKSVDTEGRNTILETFQPENELVEIGQHTFNHITIAPIKTRPDKEPVSEAVLRDELFNTDALIRDVFETNVIGLRAPLGYAGGVPESVASVIRDQGLLYVSSDLRDKNWGINPVLIEDGELRQPRTYGCGLKEIPTHGWQDSALTGKSKTKGTTNYPKTPKDVLEHYRNIIKEALKLEPGHEEELCVAFCMHPWAMKKYDPELSVLRGLLDYTSENGAQIVSYGNHTRS